MAKNHMGRGKKKLNSGVTAVFIDEAGYTFVPYVGRTWAPKKITPILRHSQRRWKKVSAISGVAINLKKEPRENLYFRLHPEKNISSAEVVAFLRQLSQNIEGDIVLVWDNLRVHKSKPVKEFLDKNPRIESVYLPPYCPELNPDEGVWNWTKTKNLANVCVHDITELTILKRINHLTDPPILTQCYESTISGYFSGV